uniref:sigma factor-like helix-turn-helix DNA-binding protein n=1 Tax=Enterocloster clostridioformis TaxID=1531 RepID=UPI001C3C34B7|nr:sigma factor-like helix-turn-helix DNA-binding protein [Enterocloster clostridioformis]
MAFNKAREEYKWKQWKEAEEKKMRELGVDESVIASLREYDWNVFNQERTYQSWQVPDTNTVNENAVSDDSLKVKQPVTVQEFIKAVDDKELRGYLAGLDPLTMRILLLKTFGYRTKDIVEILDITTDTIYQRMKRLRKKFKKFLI